MTTATTPPIPEMAGGDQPQIGNGFRLQWEAAQDCYVLLYPEGMVKLNPSAAEILKRCDGRHSVAEIVAELETVFRTTDLQPEVAAFLDMARQQRWVRQS